MDRLQKISKRAISRNSESNSQNDSRNGNNSKKVSQNIKFMACNIINKSEDVTNMKE